MGPWKLDFHIGSAEEPVALRSLKLLPRLIATFFWGTAREIKMAVSWPPPQGTFADPRSDCHGPMDYVTESVPRRL